jgi:indolepyruvate ferredoxin oxidoreductase alpha subunit
VLLVLDNSTTAMTGQQEHPATGRTLNHEPTSRLSIEGLARAVGIPHVDVINPLADREAFAALVRARLDSGELAVIVARRVCVLAGGRIRKYEAAAALAACGEGTP